MPCWGAARPQALYPEARNRAADAYPAAAVHPPHPTQLLRATSNSSRVTLRQSRVPEEPSTTNTPSFTLGCGGWALLCHGSLPWPSPAVWGSSLSFLSPFFSLSLFSLFSFFFSHSLIDALSARPLPHSRMRSPGPLWPGLLQSLPHPFNRR